MLTIKQILDSVSGVVAGVFPNETIYTDTVPVDFDRPSSLVEMADTTMEAESGRMVSRTMIVSVTRFCSVDDYHNSKAECLANDLTLLQRAFATPVLAVEDRYLDIGRVTGKYEADYATLTIPLNWLDDNDVQLPKLAKIEHYEIKEEVTQ